MLHRSIGCRYRVIIQIRELELHIFKTLVLYQKVSKVSKNNLPGTPVLMICGNMTLP